MIINPYLVQPSGPSYGALTTAWIAATGETDTTILGALNTLESDLTTYGLTAKMKALYPMVGGTAAKHKFNFMDARDLDAAFRLTFNGGWTHSSTGALPNGTNAYADTGLDDNTVLSLNSAHISFYSRTNVDGLYCDMGSYDPATTSGINLFSRYVNEFYGRVHNDGAGVSNSDSRGLFLANRVGSTETRNFVNSTLKLQTIASVAKASYNVVIAARNRGFNDFYSPRQCAFASIGDGLTDTEAANFYTAVQAYQTTLSRQV
jgi:hypothetical protein